MTKEEEIKQLCANIRYLRERAGLSKTRMAKIMGVTTATLTKIEEGTLPRRTGVKVLLRLSDRSASGSITSFCPPLVAGRPRKGRGSKDGIRKVAVVGQPAAQESGPAFPRAADRSSPPAFDRMGLSRYPKKKAVRRAYDLFENPKGRVFGAPQPVCGASGAGRASGKPAT